MFGCFLFVSIVHNISAQDHNFYAYSNIEEKYDVHARNNVVRHIMTNPVNNTNFSGLKLGRGIKIYDPNDLPKFLYPVWANNKIIGSLLVIDDNGELSCVYTDVYNQKLNSLIRITSKEKPMTLIVDNRGLLAVIDNEWYGLSNDDRGVFNGEIPYDKNIVNAFEDLDLVMPISYKIPTGYSLPWKVYEVQRGYYCYSYALGNILLNKGYKYRPADIQKFMNYSTDASNYEMNNYLKSIGKKSTYSSSGTLAFSTVKNAIYHNKDYIYIAACRKNEKNERVCHAFVITGYFQDADSKLNSYSVWNPWYDQQQTFDDKSKLITTNDSRVYKWDAGYLYNIK